VDISCSEKGWMHDNDIVGANDPAWLRTCARRRQRILHRLTAQNWHGHTSAGWPWFRKKSIASTLYHHLHFGSKPSSNNSEKL